MSGAANFSRSSGVTPDPAITLPRDFSTFFGAYGLATTSTFTLSNDKSIYNYTTGYDQFGPFTYLAAVGTWSTGTASSYDARATVLDGALSSGIVGSWLNLGTTRGWDVLQNTVGTSSARLTIEIRNASTLQRVMVGVVTIAAQRYS